MQLRSLLRLGALAATCALVAPVSCNSIFTKSPPIDTSDKPWEYVDVVGTNIPQRVVKGQQPITASPVSNVSAESWRDAMERSAGHTSRGR